MFVERAWILIIVVQINTDLQGEAGLPRQALG